MSLVRRVDTGSPTFYVLEFKRGEKFVYAMWLPQGERDAVVTLAEKGG